uniref:Uncharacterized protein n=1 Tax=Arion vulgaris TaxID=1028688 RepID=A0A0B7AMZ0_9EUPU
MFGIPQEDMSPTTEFLYFKWFDFDVILWENVKASIRLLTDKGMHIDDSKRCDQYCNLEKFASTYKNQVPSQKSGVHNTLVERLFSPCPMREIVLVSIQSSQFHY